MPGLYLEQFTVGQVFEHDIRRTVTEGDNVWFCAVTCNPARIHIDADYCASTEFKKPLVNSIFTLGLVIGLSVQDTTFGTTIANLGMTDVEFPQPVFAGDTLRSRTTVLTVRESKSRPNAGVVGLRHEGLNQRGDIVCTCLRQALMLRRPGR
jgi:acyl dehydratase